MRKFTTDELVGSAISSHNLDDLVAGEMYLGKVLPRPAFKERGHSCPQRRASGRENRS